MNKFTTAAITTLTLASTVTGMTPANAASAYKPTPLPSLTLTQQEKAAARGISNRSFTVKDIGKVQLHSSTTRSLDFSHASSLRIRGIDYLTIPMRNYAKGSNLTVTFRGKDIVRVSELRAVETSHTTGRVTLWTNGTLQMDKTSSIPKAPHGEMRAAWSWSRLNNCLAGAGVAAWLITALSFACTPGPQMVLCIAAMGIGAGTASYCVRAAASS